jgi:feruloyl esterase
MQKFIERYGWAVGAGAVALAWTSRVAGSPASDATVCTALTHYQPAIGQIVSAELTEPPYVAHWSHNPGGAGELVFHPFCFVTAQVSSAPGSDIRYEVWLPVRGHWNGRLLGVGASGSLGAINRKDLASGVNRGYASVATDNGHRGYGIRDSQWALGHPERVEDFGYRAQHLATESAKEILKKFYGLAERHSYFLGCSQGGTKGMMAAQRFPADYDGIVAGAPVYSWSKEMTFQAWNYRALTWNNAATISEAQMQALYDATKKQCAGPDGLIADPRQCAFDPRLLACSPSAEKGEKCLSATQIEAVGKMYRGPRTSSGESINRGLTVGSESGWPWLWNLAEPDPTRSGSWLGVYRYMVFADPDWRPESLDFDRDPAVAKKKLGPLLEPDSPDLGAFQRRGGKLIVYHGWADSMVPPETTTDYRAAVVARLGTTTVNKFLRVFMVPGMDHCGGGPGPDQILQKSDSPSVSLTPENDVLTALERWVEHGVAPDRLIASKVDHTGAVTQTRLLCPEPHTAQYRGSGSALDAGSWKCVQELAAASSIQSANPAEQRRR